MFVADIEKGIQGTDIKAAFIKCAADEPGLTENVEKLHRAAAKASVQTGAPIMAHSRPPAGTGPKQVEIFEEEGVDLSKVQIAHCGDTDDVDYIEGLHRQGRLRRARPLRPRALPAVRQAHRDGARPAREGPRRAPLPLGRLVRTLDWYPPEAVGRAPGGRAWSIDWDVRIVHDKVIPGLREGGMTDDQLETMMVRNPVAWLTGE